MSAILISACLIVKNEQKFLAKCLRSVQPLVDEIVVVDTGSRDRTKQIAAECGARVFDFKWTGNFAAARNESLRHARGEWILTIDADECVRPFNRAQLRRLLRTNSNAAYRVIYHIRPGFTPILEPRLFRNHPLIRFKGGIHENIWLGLAKVSGKVGRCRLIFDHFGYEGDQHWKHKRDIPLLVRSLGRDPRQVFHWCHLAIAYQCLGKMRLAGKTWHQAVAVLRRKRILPGSGGLAYAGLIQFELDRARGTQSLHRLESLANEGIRCFPENLELHWLRGQIQMKTGQYEAAVSSLHRLLTSGKSDLGLQPAGFDARMSGVLAYQSLAICHFKLGHYARAAKYFRLGVKAEPGNSELRIKSMVCDRLAADRKRR